MKPKIVFIINSIQQQRCIKRIEEFIAHDYEVEAYGFNRAEVVPTLPEHFRIHVIGQFTNTMSYPKRLLYMYKTLRPILRQYKDKDVVFYYFLLDVAMVCRAITNKPYIYEESDLMQTYLPSRILCEGLNRIDRWLIRHSLLTTMTSEGFIQYHFGSTPPKNVVLVPNRLNPTVTSLTYHPSQPDIHHLRVGFVGSARYESIIRFSDAFLSTCPQHELHFYGIINDRPEEFERIKNTYPNVYFHGKFSNPKDLPSIYEQVDIVLATYDNRYENVRYAEPNKLYEAAYFETPIIVSSDTFLAQKTQKWGVGYALNPLDGQAVKTFFETLTQAQLDECIAHCKAIDKNALLDHNPQLFERLSWN